MQHSVREIGKRYSKMYSKMSNKRKNKKLFKFFDFPSSKYGHTPNWETATLEPPADVITFTSLSLDRNGNVIRHADRGVDMYGNIVYRDETPRVE